MTARNSSVTKKSSEKVASHSTLGRNTPEASPGSASSASVRSTKTPGASPGSASSASVRSTGPPEASTGSASSASVRSTKTPEASPGSASSASVRSTKTPEDVTTTMIPTTEESTSFSEWTDLYTGSPTTTDSPYICKDNTEVFRDWVCDGIQDCKAGEDEDDCPSITMEYPGTTELPSTTESKCQWNSYACHGVNEECIENHKVCNRIDDCTEGDDEANCTQPNCPAYTLKCHQSLECISKMLVCDGIPNCDDGSDEDDCSPCGVNQYRCRAEHVCIRKIFRCDGYSHCNEGDDERDCEGEDVPKLTCDHEVNSEGYVKAKTMKCYCSPEQDKALPEDVSFEQFSIDEKGGDKHFKKMNEPFTFGKSSDNKEQRLYCFYRSNLPPRRIQVKFAYLEPKSISLTVEHPIVEFCAYLYRPIKTSGSSWSWTRNHQAHHIEAECAIYTGDVNPRPKFSFAIDDNEFDTPVHGTEEGTLHVRRFQFKPEQGGSYKIKCRVVHPIYDDLTQEREQAVEVLEPPFKPPTLEVNGNNYTRTPFKKQDVAILEGMKASDVKCYAPSEGYPSTKVSSSECCFSYEDKKVIRAECTCKAKHESTCYTDYETTVKFEKKSTAEVESQG
ncbi:low-density lipoprotein receptor [Elysia marginata]|uniref:Low-density lipoprotein receptor n=1 Tax=Elysia marginata TaxID=1093978 RepID=A0AAV4JA89_9GAST|nr:low-density lipoprotein receptor [Elysia marginata]